MSSAWNRGKLNGDYILETKLLTFIRLRFAEHAANRTGLSMRFTATTLHTAQDTNMLLQELIAQMPMMIMAGVWIVMIIFQ